VTSTFTLESIGEKPNKLKIQKLNTAQKKTNNAKHSKIKLAWFSRLLRHSARKRGTWAYCRLYVTPEHTWDQVVLRDKVTNIQEVQLSLSAYGD